MADVAVKQPEVVEVEVSAVKKLQVTFVGGVFKAKLLLVELIDVLVRASDTKLDDGVWATMRGFLMALNLSLGKFVKIGNGAVSFTISVIPGMEKKEMAPPEAPKANA